MNIYVSNLDTEIKNADLRTMFSAFGEVESAKIAMDVFTDESRGFGYVEMPNDAEAKAAITALNKSEVKGHVIAVTEAEQKETHSGSYKVGNGAVNVYRFKKN